jgi:hypothetical protein
VIAAYGGAYFSDAESFEDAEPLDATDGDATDAEPDAHLTGTDAYGGAFPWPDGEAGPGTPVYGGPFPIDAASSNDASRRDAAPDVLVIAPPYGVPPPPPEP